MPETTKNPSKKEEPKDKEPAKDDKSKEEPAKEESKEASKAEAPAPAPAPLPDDPTDRDVCMGEEHHKGTVLLNDLIRLHYILLKKETKRIPTEEKDVQDLAARLTQLMLHGKQFELSGAKDVPRPFLKGEGRFFQSKDNVNKWEKVTENQAKAFVTKTILSQFESISKSDATPDLKESVDALSEGDPANHSAPRPCDVLFLPIEYPYEENMPYEHQTGNKHLLFLASQHCAADTNDSFKRVEAAFKLVTSKVEVNSGTELVLKTPRYVIQMLVDNQNAWKEMERSDLAEFAVIFVFEVFLEKQIHGLGAPMSAQVASLLTEHAKPGTTPFDNPTVHDVLFGRGGMTNGHPGNRRFRDIIALHRPDYIRATKMDKPNVARRIVRAIRQGNPVGRFLKKAEDGKWYDVGDRVAAEKTSQGLRERSNTEKRQRSALREALRIRREDLVDGEEGEGAAKKAKLSDTALGIAPAYTGYGGGIPLSLSMKEKPKDSKSKKGKKLKDGEDEANTESLPPNAVDENGNILVTDYDILCGRGGLTNHHKGNKRFRDIVALHRPDYVRAPKIQKPSVARVIVRAIRNGDPPGRFIKKDEKTGKWIDIGDKRAAEKTSQALREKPSDEKGQGVLTPFNSPTLVVPIDGATPASTTVKKDEKGEDKKKGKSKKGANGEESKEEAVKAQAGETVEI